MTVAAEISGTSLFVACMSLTSDTYTVPISGSSFSPFDLKYGVKLKFEERTFGDDTATLEFKVCHISDWIHLCIRIFHFFMSPS